VDPEFAARAARIRAAEHDADYAKEHAINPCNRCGSAPGAACEYDEPGVRNDSYGDDTWRRGFVHLTVDGFGLVSLWDHEMDVASYVKLQLTPEQVRVIEETMKKGGPTP
jgi:hypothetical protein